MQRTDLAATAIASRRHVLDWRDRHALAAFHALDQAITHLDGEIRDRIEKADWQDAWLNTDRFMRTRIDPLVQPAVAAAAGAVLDRARKELGVLIDALPMDASLAAVPAPGGAVTELADSAVSLMPLAGGIALAGAVPALAVSTASAGFLGLSTVLVVSWPIAIGLGGVAAAGIGLGLHRTAGFRKRQDARLRSQVDARIDAAIFGDGDRGHALLARLHATIDAGADAALERIAHAAA